nr:hypothetical protein [Opitutae bacterium KCR 482]
LKRPPIKASRHPLVNTFFEVFSTKASFLKNRGIQPKAEAFKLKRSPIKAKQPHTVKKLFFNFLASKSRRHSAKKRKTTN